MTCEIAASSQNEGLKRVEEFSNFRPSSNYKGGEKKENISES